MIILSILLFTPVVFIGNAINNSIDLFSAIVFIVAGPAVGFILQQIVSMISRISDTLRGHTESNIMKQNWIRLKLISKDKMDVSGLESIHANYIFGMTTSTALSIIVLGYIIFLLLSPEHIGDQYEMIYSTLTNDTSVFNDNVSNEENRSLWGVIMSSFTILVVISISLVAFLLALFSRLEYNQVQVPLMLRLFRENNLCIYCAKLIDESKEGYKNHITHHHAKMGIPNEIGDPDVKTIRLRMNLENRSP